MRFFEAARYTLLGRLLTETAMETRRDNVPRLPTIVSVMLMCTMSLVTYVGAYEVSELGKNPGYKAQKLTVVSMICIVANVKLYADEHGGKFPTSLPLLRDMYKFPDRSLNDGWDRALYYYSTGDTYVLASFGQSGKPDAQESVAGGESLKNSYEADIVVINGEWAQSPFGVGRSLP